MTNPPRDPHQNARDAVADASIDAERGLGAAFIVDEQGRPYSHKKALYTQLKDAFNKVFNRIPHGDRLMIALTAVVAFSTVGQLAISYWNNVSTGKQVDRLIDTAARIDDAADSFSKSSADISRSVNDAVTKLGTQAAATQSAAKTADSTLNNQKKTFDVDQRPYIVADIPTFVQAPLPGIPLFANMTLKNIGRTPARHEILSDFEMFSYENLHRPDEIPILFAFLDKTYKEFRVHVAEDRAKVDKYKAEIDLAPDQPTFATNQVPAVIDKDDWQKFMRGTVSLYFIGLVAYSDTTGHKYETEFCYSYFGDNPKVWHTCDGHNTIK